MHYEGINAREYDHATVEAFRKNLPKESGPAEATRHGVNKIPGRQYYASGLRWIYLVSNKEHANTAFKTKFAKRSVDIALSAMAIIFLIPVYLALALAVATTSKGPILFIQNRPGKGGVMFPMLKFRSMQQNLGDASGVSQTVKNDKRLTPVGGFIRKTSMDELPQLFNVLLGHMSLIGPRPHPLGMQAGGVDYRDLVPYYDDRHLIRPGLSGWAQANGLRGPTTDPELAIARIEHDVAYLQNQSLMLDLITITRTLRQVLTGGFGL